MIFHNILHRFHASIGTGTSSVKAKLLQQLVAIREEVLYNILLDMLKSYDALDRDRCLGILVEYGVGQSYIRLLQRYWYFLTIVAQTGQYFGTPFKGFQGVT